jgi:hypothetical protein
MERVVITKVGETPSPIHKGKSRKTLKTFPKGILKVSDPAKSPPKRKTLKSQTIQLVTERGSKRFRKTLKRKISKLSDAKVRSLVEKNGLLKNKNTPPALMREMVEGGVLSGFISLE